MVDEKLPLLKRHPLSAGLEFTRADEMAAIGAQATIDALPQLKEALSKLDDKMFKRAS